MRNYFYEASADVVKVEIPSFSSLVAVVHHPAITDKHELVAYEFSDSRAQLDDWTWETTNGSFTITSGRINGSTSFTGILANKAISHAGF